MNEHRYQFDIIKHPFETIDDYCNDQEKGITIRNIAFCIYTVRFLEAIKEDIKEKGGEDKITMDDIILIEKRLLSHKNMYVESAERMLNKDISIKRTNHLTAVITSALGSLVFASFLLLCVAISKYGNTFMDGLFNLFK